MGQITNFITVPHPDDIKEWHFCVYGLKESPLEGGIYHGKLIFPQEYPYKPPSIFMITPNGRFNPLQRICMSMSDYHPELWNPVWSVETIITGLVSFFNSNESEKALGCIQTKDEEK